MNILKLFIVFPIAIVLSACEPNMKASDHRRDINDDSSDTISVAKVQRDISVGMSGAEVATVLGSPNVVTSDDQRRETWIYDKISTERIASGSADRSYGHLFGGGASSTSQKTLTVIIKFDKSGRVRDFAYNTSKF